MTITISSISAASSIIAVPLAGGDQKRQSSPSPLHLLTPADLTPSTLTYSAWEAKPRSNGGGLKTQRGRDRDGFKRGLLGAALKSVSAASCRLAVILVALILVLPTTVQAQSSKSKAAKGANNATIVLRNRVQQLEGQVLDMQVIIGTLQSLARTGGSGGGGGGAAVSGPVASSAGGDNSRIRFLETQIQALTTQVERLSRQVRGDRRGDAGGYVPSTGRVAGVTSEDLSAPTRGGEASGGFRTSAMPSDAVSGDVISGFGATTVTPGNRGAGSDAIGRMLQGEPRDNGAVGGGRGAGGSRGNAVIARARSIGDPKQLYETAYGYLLQQNYKNARSAFGEFLDLFPDDPLAGNAQYWLGETFYVRRKYRSAANAFLKGYQKYPRSNKAPDNLLKLSMSLERLGQKEAACSSFLELQEKFPRAAAHVKKKTRTEIRRLKC